MDIKKIFGIGMEHSFFSISSKKIPEGFDGFKILHLSDFHCEPKAGMLEDFQDPDVIFFTGDMTDNKCKNDSFIKLLKYLLQKAPVYMVSGNHDVFGADYSEFLKKSRKMGAVILQNESVRLCSGKDTILLHGIEDAGRRAGGLLDEALEKSIKQLKRERELYEILLFHRANKLDFFKDENFDLILSGHMHGGQIRLARAGGVFAPKSSFGDEDGMFFPKYSGGRYKLGESDVIVSRGMGNPVALPRFGNPTQICHIVLNRTTEKESNVD